MFKWRLKTAIHRDAARPVYRALALTCTGLGAAGLVLPLLPTTPFLLAAVWAAARGSPRLEQWIYRRRSFAAVLTAWHEQRAVPAGAKYLACLLMAVSWAMLWRTGSPSWVLVAAATLFLGVTGFLLSRPSPSNAAFNLLRSTKRDRATP